MSLDGGGRPLHGEGLNDVRVESSLHQEAAFAMRLALLQVAGGFIKHGDEFPADAFALFFRVGNTLELSEKTIRGVYADHVEPEALPVHGERVFKFVFAKETRVYKDVGQAIANRFVDQNCGDGGVHAAAQAADGPFVADSLANGLYGFFDERRAIPLGLGLADLKEEISQDFRAAVGMVHFRVKFNRVYFALDVFDSADGVFCFGNTAKTGRERTNVIAVAVPYV